jgi:NCAIR mutase (PurE)-related protein
LDYLGNNDNRRHDDVRWDGERPRRRGFPESVLGVGKSLDQLRTIAAGLTGPEPILFTRLDPEFAEALQRDFPHQPMTYHPRPRILVWGTLPDPDPHRRAAVLAAGTADVPVAEEAIVTLRADGVTVDAFFDVGVAGLHRLLNAWDAISASDVIIVVAGMDGALPSVVGGLSPRPVIAVPTSVGYGAHFGGLAPLLTMLNSCAEGVGVVNIDNGFGAARLASQILRLKVAGTNGE